MSLSQAYASTHAVSQPGFGAALRSARARFGLFVAERRAMAAARRELDAYSDRQLADLGLSRADIPSIVTGTYAR